MEGGIADYTRILAREMAALGHEVHILTRTQASKHHNDPGVSVNAIVKNWTRFAQLRQWAQQLDIINLQYQTAAFDMSPAIHFWPSRVRIPFVTTFHDLRFPYLFPKAGFLRPWIVRELAHRSTAAIATNRGDEKTLKQDVPRLPIMRIPLGSTVQIYPTDAETRRIIRQRIGADENTCVVAHFGFINASKGVDTLFKAISLAEVPLKVLMMGGRTGSSDPTNERYVADIDQLAEDLGIAPYWTGFLPDEEAGAYFAAADVIALPFKDGASLRRTSLQAALAYSCAIITTQPTDTDLPEFTDGETLLYVPPDDPQQLAAALQRLAHDQGLRDVLRTGARSTANQFRWDAIAAKTVDLYSQFLR